MRRERSVRYGRLHRRTHRLAHRIGVRRSLQCLPAAKRGADFLLFREPSELREPSSPSNTNSRADFSFRSGSSRLAQPD